MTDEQRKLLDELHARMCDSIMHQAQVHVSTLAMEEKYSSETPEARAAWERLRMMVEELSDLAKRAAVMLDETQFASQQLTQWLGAIAAARLRQEDPTPIIDKLIASHVKMMPSTGLNVH